VGTIDKKGERSIGGERGWTGEKEEAFSLVKLASWDYDSRRIGMLKGQAREKDFAHVLDEKGGLRRAKDRKKKK